MDNHEGGLKGPDSNFKVHWHHDLSFASPDLGVKAAVGSQRL